MIATMEAEAALDPPYTVSPAVPRPGPGARPPDVDPSARTRFWCLLHVVSLGTAAAALGYLNRHQWFHNDEWDFILRRGRQPSVGIFTPHNEHWSTIPALIYRGLLETVGLRSYQPYAAVTILLHLAATHLVWRASRRAGASLPMATGAAGIFAVLGAGGENLLWAFQMGFTAAVACGWWAVILHDHEGPFSRRDVAGSLVLVVGLMCAGPALAFVGVAGLTVALRRRRWRDTALVVGAPMVVYVTWWTIAGRHHRGPSAGALADPWKLVDFAWRGVTNVSSEVVGIPGAGAVLMLALVAWWLRHAHTIWGRASLAAAGLIGAFGFFLLTGLARIAWGPEQADLSRYLYVGAALLVPAAAVALTRVLPDTRATQVGMLIICAGVAIHNVGLLRVRAAQEVDPEQDLRREIAAYGAFLAEGPRLADDRVAYFPRSFVRLDSEDMAVLADYRWHPGQEISERQRLTIETTWQVGLEPPSGALGQASVASEDMTLTPSLDGDCVAARPLEPGAQLTLSTTTESLRVRLTTEDETSLDVQLTSGRARSDVRGLVLDGGEGRDLVSYAAGRSLVVTPHTKEPVEICGVGVRER